MKIIYLHNAVSSDLWLRTPLSYSVFRHLHPRLDQYFILFLWKRRTSYAVLCGGVDGFGFWPKRQFWAGSRHLRASDRDVVRNFLRHESIHLCEIDAARYSCPNLKLQFGHSTLVSLPIVVTPSFYSSQNVWLCLVPHFFCSVSHQTLHILCSHLLLNWIILKKNDLQAELFQLIYKNQNLSSNIITRKHAANINWV